MVYPDLYASHPDVVRATAERDAAIHNAKVANSNLLRQQHDDMHALIRAKHRFNDASDGPTKDQTEAAKCALAHMFPPDFLASVTVHHRHGETCDPDGACGGSHEITLDAKACAVPLPPQLLDRMSTTLVGVWAVAGYCKGDYLPSDQDVYAAMACVCRVGADDLRERVRATFCWNTAGTDLMFVVRSRSLAAIGAQCAASGEAYTMNSYRALEQQRIANERTTMNMMAGSVIRLLGPSTNYFACKLGPCVSVPYAYARDFTQSGTFVAHDNATVLMNATAVARMSNIYTRYDGTDGTAPLSLHSTAPWVPTRLLSLAGVKERASYLFAPPRGAAMAPPVDPSAPCDACVRRYASMGREVDMVQV
jgi:hypothetical protein